MRYTFFALLVLITLNCFGQSVPEIISIDQIKTENFLSQSIIRTTNPPAVSVRTAAQFEEMQAVTITWNVYSSNDYQLLAEIINHAQESVDVFIICSQTNTSTAEDSATIKNYLTGQGISLNRVHFVVSKSDLLWARDYGANSIYENEVNNLSFCDWKYNRQSRVNDDTVPRRIAAVLGIPIYETTQSPNRLIHTGGNFMCDGHGTGFSSKLVLTENASTNSTWNNNLNEAGVDSIMKKYMGIKKYIKMETLPYDGIHHIDMHMKLLDEETLLIGQYPTGVADGAQIESNINYITSHFMDCYDRPYTIIRIPQPPMENGNYPDNGGDYLTYANAIILNNIVLVPKYYTQYDTTALRIWKNAMPGYKIYQLDCNNIIQYSGAIHCITHEIGVSDPIFISHAKLLDTYNTTSPYAVDAYINTSSGVSSAVLHWSLDTLNGYASLPMNDVGNGNYHTFIPAQPVGSKIFYYIEATSFSGKTVRKPLVAPAGVILFHVLAEPSDVASITNSNSEFFTPYPIPASNSINLSFNLKTYSDVSFEVTDILGNKILNWNAGNLSSGIHQYQYDINALPAGNYLIHFKSRNGLETKKFNKID